MRPAAYANWDELYDYVAIRRCRWDGMCSTCMAKIARRGRRPMRCAHRSRSSIICKTAQRIWPCWIAATCLASQWTPCAARQETPELRTVFDRLLDHCDELNGPAIDLPRLTRSRRLRLETAVIVGLAHRLTRRLRSGDPLARRVRLTKGDAVGSMVAALRWL